MFSQRIIFFTGKRGMELDKYHKNKISTTFFGKFLKNVFSYFDFKTVKLTFSSLENKYLANTFQQFPGFVIRLVHTNSSEFSCSGAHIFRLPPSPRNLFLSYLAETVWTRTNNNKWRNLFPLSPQLIIPNSTLKFVLPSRVMQLLFSSLLFTSVTKRTTMLVFGLF